MESLNFESTLQLNQELHFSNPDFMEVCTSCLTYIENVATDLVLSNFNTYYDGIVAKIAGVPQSNESDILSAEDDAFRALISEIRGDLGGTCSDRKAFCIVLYAISARSWKLYGRTM